MLIAMFRLNADWLGTAVGVFCSHDPQIARDGSGETDTQVEDARNINCEKKEVDQKHSIIYITQRNLLGEVDLVHTSWPASFCTK